MSCTCLPWHRSAAARLLARYGLCVREVPETMPIPGSFWGGDECGLIGARLFVRRATPLHSLLHEAAHYVCVTPTRRARLHTDAGSDDREEEAVCFLQLRLAQAAGVRRGRLLRDMDAWGYSFRFGSARAWYQHDAGAAREWLRAEGLIDGAGMPTFRLRAHPPRAPTWSRPGLRASVRGTPACPTPAPHPRTTHRLPARSPSSPC